MPINKGIAFRRGTRKEQDANKLSGRQCTFVSVYERDNGMVSRKRCTHKTGKNYFFCKEHFEQIDDYGMEVNRSL